MATKEQQAFLRSLEYDPEETMARRRFLPKGKPPHAGGGLTVQISRAAGQNDRVNTGPVNFTATFSKTAVGFTNADVSFAGSTVGGTLAATVTGSGPYNVAVSGMTGNGIVQVSIPSGVVDDKDKSYPASNAATVMMDVTGPSVTINRAPEQDDPTTESPINFTVVFSSTVIGFAANDISFTGTTAGGTLSAVITGSGANYNVAVSGMTTAGNVVASIPAGAATDMAGNLAQASTSTDNLVEFVVTPSGGPVVDFVANFGASTSADNTAAWNAWIAFGQANPGSTLTIPAGEFVTGTNFSGAFVPSQGCLNSTIVGVAGPPGQPPLTKLTSTAVAVTGSKDIILADNSASQGKFASASAGATSVTLLNGADAAKFAIGKFVQITGLCLQNGGFPPNTYNVEYNRISNVVGAVLHLVKPLRFSYLDTWPDAINPNDLGKPNILALHAWADSSYTYKNLVFNTTGFNGAVNFGPSVLTRFDNCAFTGWGPAASMSERVEMLNSVQIGSNNECDKLVENLLYRNCSGGTLSMQSSSIIDVLVDDCEINLVGTGRFTTVNNSTLDLCQLGAIFGICESVTLQDTIISSPSVAWGLIDFAAWHAAFSGGSFIVPKASITGASVYEEGMRHFIPGRKVAYCYYSGFANVQADDGRAHGFTVTAVRESGGNYIVDTDMAAEPNPLPTYFGIHPVTHYYAYPVQSTLVQSNINQNYNSFPTVPPAVLLP